jgi:hypothetical protein
LPQEANLVFLPLPILFPVQTGDMSNRCSGTQVTLLGSTPIWAGNDPKILTGVSDVFDVSDGSDDDFSHFLFPFVIT